MKKLASIVLVISMLFVLSISAFAAATNVDHTPGDAEKGANGQNYTAGKDITGTNHDLNNGVQNTIQVQVNESETITGTDSIYSWAVTLLWDDMAFTCTKTAAATSWDAAKHVYITGDPTYTWTIDSHNEIDVINDSNRNVTVGLAYSAGANYSGVNQFVFYTMDGTTKTQVTDNYTLAASDENYVGTCTNGLEQDFYLGFIDDTAADSAAVALYAANSSITSPVTIGNITVTITGYDPLQA